MNKAQAGIDKKDIKKSFNKASETYDQAATMQRLAADCLLNQINRLEIHPETLLDLGSGTGYCSENLNKIFPNSMIIALDLAEQMLHKTKNNYTELTNLAYICGDAEQLPFKPQSIDLILSSMMLHWCGNLHDTLHNIRQLLKPGGLFLFTTLGLNTMHEIKQSWAGLDNNSHVHSFIDTHHLTVSIEDANFRKISLNKESLILSYSELYPLLIDLKKLGTNNILNSRNKGLTGKTKFAKFQRTYEKLRNSEGLIPITYEIIHGQAWI